MIRELHDCKLTRYHLFLLGLILNMLFAHMLILKLISFGTLLKFHSSTKEIYINWLGMFTDKTVISAITSYLINSNH